MAASREYLETVHGGQIFVPLSVNISRYLQFGTEILHNKGKQIHRTHRKWFGAVENFYLADFFYLCDFVFRRYYSMSLAAALINEKTPENSGTVFVSVYAFPNKIFDTTNPVGMVKHDWWNLPVFWGEKR